MTLELLEKKGSLDRTMRKERKGGKQEVEKLIFNEQK